MVGEFLDSFHVTTMKQLTYADRELLLRTFDSLKDGWDGADSDLLSQVCEWAKSIVPTFGFEHALTRDVTVLSRYLVDRKDDQDIADTSGANILKKCKTTETVLNRTVCRPGHLLVMFVVNPLRSRQRRRTGAPRKHREQRWQKKIAIHRRAPIGC